MLSIPTYSHSQSIYQRLDSTNTIVDTGVTDKTLGGSKIQPYTLGTDLKAYGTIIRRLYDSMRACDAARLRYTDTAGMLATRLKIGDTSTMLTPYLRGSAFIRALDSIWTSSDTDVIATQYRVDTASRLTRAWTEAWVGARGYLTSVDSNIYATRYGVDTGVKNTRTWANGRFYLAGNPANYITLGSLSASAPLSYNSSTGVLALGTTGTAGTYGGGNAIPVITTDAYGRAITVITTAVTPAFSNCTGTVAVSQLPDITQYTTSASYSGTVTPTSTVASRSSTVFYVITAQAGNLVIAAPTGSWADGQILVIRIKDNGTARTLTYNAAFRAGADVALPTTTTLGKTLYLEFVYNSTDTKWDLVGKSDGY